MLAAIEREAVQPSGLAWQQRLRQLVRLLCGVDAPELAWLPADMLALEAGIAEPKHHRRVHEELLAAWHRVIGACDDLHVKPDAATIQALHLSVWGGRRHVLLLQLDEAQAREWTAQMLRVCVAMAENAITPQRQNSLGHPASGASIPARRPPRSAARPAR